MSTLDHPLARAALQEVIDLHAFFEAWLGGTAPQTEAAFARLDRALAEGFTMVTPDGVRLPRAAVIEWLRQAHGAKAAFGPFRIAIAEAELVHLAVPLVVLGYVEQQTLGGAIGRRRSTGLIEAVPAADDRVRWLALHETWIASAS